MNDKNRISRVTTGTGDRGETGLADGSRLGKHSPAIEMLGELDELNAAIGVLISHGPDGEHQALLEKIQQCLFDLGAEIALPGTVKLAEKDVVRLEEACSSINARLPALREFVLPGGSQTAAWCHYVRTVARRSERRLVALFQQQTQNPVSLVYLNRLSDLLFVMARDINRQAQHPENLWHG